MSAPASTISHQSPSSYSSTTGEPEPFGKAVQVIKRDSDRFGECDSRWKIYESLKDFIPEHIKPPYPVGYMDITTHAIYELNISFMATCYINLGDAYKGKFAGHILKTMNDNVDIWTDSDHLGNNEIKEIDERMNYFFSYQLFFDCFVYTVLQSVSLQRNAEHHIGPLIDLCVKNSYAPDYKLVVSKLLESGYDKAVINLLTALKKEYEKDITEDKELSLKLTNRLDDTLLVFILKNFDVYITFDDLESFFHDLKKETLLVVVENYKKKHGESDQLSQYIEKVNNRNY